MALGLATPSGSGESRQRASANVHRASRVCELTWAKFDALPDLYCVTLWFVCFRHLRPLQYVFLSLGMLTMVTNQTNRTMREEASLPSELVRTPFLFMKQILGVGARLPKTNAIFPQKFSLRGRIPSSTCGQWIALKNRVVETCVSVRCQRWCWPCSF